MPKGWLYDRRESGSKRRAEPQRYVVDELSCFPSVCERDNQKDSLGASKGVITSWPYYSIYLSLLEVLSSSIGDTPTLFGCFLIILLHSQIQVYLIHLPVRHYNSLI
jgi:hypothetical protein